MQGKRHKAKTGTDTPVAYRLPLLLEKIVDGHLPSGYSWFGLCYLTAPEDHWVFRIAGLVGLDYLLAQ